MTISLKGTTYNIIDGAVYQDHKNEQLDTATVRFQTVGKIANLKPLELTSFNGRWMVIDSINIKQINFTATPTFEYSLNLISEMKLLEGVVLPNLKITQPISGNKDSLWTRLNEIWEVYCPKVRVGSNNVYTLQNRYAIDSALQSVMNIDCPEFTWNTPTLREVLNDLFLIVDYVPFINANRQLSFISLVSVGSEISRANLNYVQSSIVAEEFASQLRTPIVNAQAQTDHLNSFTELVGFRNDDSLLINDGSRIVQTSRPISQIESIKMCGVGIGFGVLATGTEQNPTIINPNYLFESYFEIDITPIVLEKQVRDLLPVLRPNGSPNPTTMAELASYQESTFYYVKNGDKIYFNQQFQENSLFTVDTIYVLENIILNVLVVVANKPSISGITLPAGQFILNPNWDYAWGQDNNNWVNNLKFKIKYKGINEFTVDVGRKINDVPAINTRTVFDNQSAAYVNSVAQGKLSYQKINRVGNEIVVINGLYPSNATLPQLGDLYDGNIIFSRQLTFNANTVAVNLYATKNYVLQNYYTGVASRNRSYQFLSASDATFRGDIEKHFLEFSFSMKVDDVSDSNPNPASIFISPLSSYSSNSDWKFVVSRFENAIGIQKPAQATGQFNGYYTELNRGVFGNSIFFTWHMKDNIEVGRYIADINPRGGGGYLQKAWDYVDSNGETKFMYWRIYPVLSPVGITLPTQPRGYNANTLMENQLNEYSRNLPLVNISSSTSYGYNGKKLFYKDNGETLGLTLQFEFCTDTPNIVFTEEFIRKQKIINPNSYNIAQQPYFVWSSNTSTYRQNDVNPRGTVNTLMNISITVLSDESVRITLVGGTTPTASWGIVGPDNKLLIGVNVAGQATPRVIYLNKKYLQNDDAYSISTGALPNGTIKV